MRRPPKLLKAKNWRRSLLPVTLALVRVRAFLIKWNRPLALLLIASAALIYGLPACPLCSIVLLSACFLWSRQDARRTRLIQRRRDGECLRCGYDRSGLREGARCPECGETSEPSRPPPPPPGPMLPLPPLPSAMPVSQPASPVIHRFEVTSKPGHADPIGDAVKRDAAAIGIDGISAGSVRATHVYLIQAPLTTAQTADILTELLTDPVTEVGRIGVSAACTVDGQIVEVHPLPGVMDPVAQSVEAAVEKLVGVRPRVSTGWRYDIAGVTPADARTIGERLLANTVIQRIETKPYHPASFPAAQAHDAVVRTIPLTGLDDAALQKLSRDAHLFLSLDEMRSIQAEYKAQGREPREIELETLAQTWSEHCVHKTLKSTIHYSSSMGASDPINWKNRPNHTIHADGSVTIDNLLKSTVAAATFELIKEGIDWTLSVFTDNSGVIALDDKFGVCIKVETHNHPSAIEPYGGAATGAGGCIRDVIGTGLGARPIANTDVFCVAPPNRFIDSSGPDAAAAIAKGFEGLPPGCLPPERVLKQVVAGVRDYGNRMGIPTVNGAVHFDDRYIGNPLVFCGCIGLIPRDKIKGKARPGDRIVALGGRTGRDGIHGATFSSTELEHTSADEFSHAVQIGNAIEEKRVLDTIMRARDEDPDGPLYSGMTDCGAGGFSSAVGEMGGELGAEVHLDKAPLKYAGLSPTEIWISEAQERMVLAVPPSKLAKLREICREESVEIADLGHFGTKNSELILLYHGVEMGRMTMHLLHEGLPKPTRVASWTPAASPAAPAKPSRETPSANVLLWLLSHPTIASKHWIVRQYDHEVRGNLVVKPLVGPVSRGPGDASVLEPIPGSGRGIAIGCGLQTPMGDPERGGDPYLMTLAAIDECVRNLVCVGADPTRIAILDNFCWPSCSKPENLGSLVRAAEACYDGAKAYRTPFVSGKDSLNNQLTIPAQNGQPARTIQIPPTLLITGLGIVPHIDRCVTMDAKRAGNLLVLVGETGTAMGGSHYQLVGGSQVRIVDGSIPRTNLTRGPQTARVVASLIQKGLVQSAHDCSEGGLAVAVAEMVIAGSSAALPIGAELNLGTVAWEGKKAGELTSALFAETPSRYVLEIAKDDIPAAHALLSDTPHAIVGKLTSTGRLEVALADISLTVDDLTAAWRGTLDW